MRPAALVSTRHPDRSERALGALAQWRDRGAEARCDYTAIPPLREHASQDAKRDVARGFVALEGHGAVVCGYCGLSAASFQRDSLAAEQAKRLPRYPVPAALFGRLAVDESSKGKGLGAFLLMDALNCLLLATQTLAIHPLVVDAKDEAAVAFYRKYRFITFPDEARRLFLPMATVRRLIGG